MSARFSVSGPTPRARGLGRLFALAAAGGAVACGWLLLRADGTVEAPAAVPQDAPSALLQDVPIAFVPNLGQWDHPARYAARFGTATVLLEDDGLWLDLPERRVARGERSELRRTGRAPAAEEPARGVALRLRLLGADPAELVPAQPLSGRHGYFLGNDPSRWRADVPRYGAVRYRGAYPGVDVRMYAVDGHLEYDLELAPGSDLAQVEIEVEGAEHLRLDRTGALVIETAVGRVVQPAPRTWEVGPDAERRTVACAYELRGDKRFGFVAPAWAGEAALVVDQ